MNCLKRLILFLTLSLQCLFINGQIDVLNNQYFYHSSTINPAYAGFERRIKLAATSYKQWLGLPNAPRAQILSLQAKMGKYNFYNPKMLLNKKRSEEISNMGMGINLVHRQYGPEQNINFEFIYAYHIPIQKYHALSFGLSGMLAYHNLDLTHYRLGNKGIDPSLIIRKESMVIPDAHFGIKYTDKKWEVGFAIREIFQTLYKKSEARNLQDSRDFFMLTGYDFNIETDFSAESFLLIKYINGREFYTDLSLKTFYKEKVWLNTSYLNFNTLHLGVGINMKNNLNLGYAYRYHIGHVKHFSNGSQELMIGWNIGKKQSFRFR